MEKERSHMTERILNLTLEIIYLLTGENYVAFKLSDGVITSNLKKNPILEPPSRSPMLEKNSNKKFLEVTKNLIKLLSGEVPLRCQDVAVYLSMEERDYLGGHCDLYNAAMMEDQPPPDGSRDGDPPERGSLYSQETSLQEDKYKADSLTHIKVEPVNEEDVYVIDDEEEFSPKISSDTSSKRFTEDGGPCPPYRTQRHQRSLRGNGRWPKSYQDENIVAIKKEEDEDEYVCGDEPCAEEEISPQISTDGRYIQSNRKKPPDNSKFEIKDRNTPELSPVEDVIASKRHPGRASDPCTNLRHFPEDIVPDPEALLSISSMDEGPYPEDYAATDPSSLTSVPFLNGGHFPEDPHLAADPPVLWGNVISSWYETNTSSSKNSKLQSPPRSTKKSSQPGKSSLAKNRAGRKTYMCSICGKCFIQKCNMVTHRRIHTGERPYSCPTCGKSFTDRSNLNRHKKIHASNEAFGDRPKLEPERTQSNPRAFPCSVCGRRFTQKAHLLTHRRTHTVS